MLSGRENYTRAIEFKRPEYIPCTLGVNFDRLDEKDESKIARIKELQAQFPSDLLGNLNAEGRSGPPMLPNVVRIWQDEWLTGWRDEGKGAKTESYPLIAGYDRLDGYAFPDPNLPGRFDAGAKLLAERGDRYARAYVWFTLFERLWMLRGFENMLMDPYLDERRFAQLRDRIVEFNLAMIDRWLALGVNGIFFSDDWGCQKGLLMNPDDWRRLYKPSYRRMFERVRSRGAHVWMHLCGNVTAIIPDLIDIGLNVLNPVQPQAMDVRHLSREFGGKLCFNGGVDVQGTMIRGTPADVKSEVRRIIELFGGFDGGYIGATSHTIMTETPLDNVIALYEAFLEGR